VVAIPARVALHVRLVRCASCSAINLAAGFELAHHLHAGGLFATAERQYRQTPESITLKQPCGRPRFSNALLLSTFMYQMTSVYANLENTA